MKKIIYFDMDGVLADYTGGYIKAGIDPGDAKHTEGFFEGLNPVPGAVDVFNKLSEKYDVYILTTAPYSNPHAWMEKVIWVKKYLGDKAYKRIIISHHKDLNKGDYLIDDSPKNGAERFEGEWIQFGSAGYPDWDSILKYLIG